MVSPASVLHWHLRFSSSCFELKVTLLCMGFFHLDVTDSSGASLGPLELLALMVDGCCQDPWVCTGMVVSHEPALAGALKSERRRSPSSLPTEEDRCACLPLLSSSAACDCETQGLGRFRLVSLCFSHVLPGLYLASFSTAHCSV